MKKNIFKKILFSSCMLISCVLFCCCDNSSKQTDSETKSSETPHPRLIQREVREDHDIDIDGRHYEWIRYCKEGVGLRIIGLRTKEDTLVGGVETLVFLGKNTKIKWIATSLEERVIPNFITAGKIIAPKGSAAIDFAKKAKKYEYFSPILIRDILCDDIVSVTDYTDTDAWQVPVKYSYL